MSEQDQTIEEETPLRLPLNNHLVVVAKASTDPIPSEHAASAPYRHLRDDHLHEVDGVETYELDADLVASHLVRHKADPVSLDAVATLLANRGIGLNLMALKKGATAAADLLVARHPDSITTTDGPTQKRIIALDLLDLSRMYGFHHMHITTPRARGALHGAEASAAAIQALDALLSDVGLSPNHAAIKTLYCKGCGNTAQGG